MDDLGHVLVETVELIHKEGVLLVRVCSDVVQLVLGCPGDADGVGDHTWITVTGRDSHHGYRQITQASHEYATANT